MRLPRLRQAWRTASTATRRTVAGAGIATLALATGATAVGPCTPEARAFTDAECEAIADLAVTQVLQLDAAEQQAGGELPAAEAEWAGTQRNLIARALAECEVDQPTTTTLPPGSTSTTLDGSTTTTIPPPSTTTTTTQPPSGRVGLPVDESAIPPPAVGQAGQRIVQTGFQKQVTDGVAAFRTNCGFSHMLFDDPLAAPGQPGRSHLHTFFGNQAANANSTTMDTGGSTCDGGTANRTGYWIPTMLDTGTDRPVTSFQNTGSSGHGPEGYLAMQVYYKSGYQGVPAASVQPFPAGLRILAGDPLRTGPGLLAWQPPGTIPAVQFACTNLFAAVIPNDSPQAIPSCPAGMVLQSVLRFPQCWDGRNLDSADHRSHMAYSNPNPSNGPIGCPSSHPVPLPEITVHERLVVPAGQNANRWARSSDTYLGAANPSGNAGYSFHADWWNGWEPTILQAWHGNCYRPVGADCQFSLGDGRELWQEPR